MRIVIAEDFALFREGIHLMLGNVTDYTIIGEVDNGEQLIHLLDSTPAEIVLTDIEMPVMNGIEATKVIKAKYPATGVLALTMFDDEHLIVDMMEAGANGYLLKSTTKEELLYAIEAAAAGKNYFCDGTTMKLSKMIAGSKHVPMPTVTVTLTEKEKAIIQLICEQYASKEIADKTELTPRTVEKYRIQIMQKMGVRNTAGVVVYAIKHGLFVP